MDPRRHYRVVNVSLTSVILAACASLQPAKAAKSQPTVKPAKMATAAAQRLLVAPVWPVQDKRLTDTVVNAATSTFSGPVLHDINQGLLAFNAPKGFNELLLASYQAEFARSVASFEQTGHAPQELKLPATLFRHMSVPRQRQEIESLIRLIKPRTADIQALDTALANGSFPAISTAKGSRKAVLMVAAKTDAYLFDNLGVQDLLLAQVDKTEEAYRAGDRLHVHVAIVDVTTGKIRYFAVGSLQRQAAQGSYITSLNALFTKMFASSHADSSKGVVAGL